MDYSATSSEELVRTCFRTGDQSAWVEFVRRFQPLIARVVLRIARSWGKTSPQLIDDLVQETYLKLYADRIRFLQNFEPIHEDAVFGYVKVFTANLVHDYFKGSHSKKRGGGKVTASLDSSELAKMPNSPLSSVSIMERNSLIRKIEERLQSVATSAEMDRDRRIFWLYYRTGLTANEIASLPSVGLTTKGVESVLLRLTRLVRQDLGGSEPSDLARSEKGLRRAESF